MIVSRNLITDEIVKFDIPIDSALNFEQNDTFPVLSGPISHMFNLYYYEGFYYFFETINQFEHIKVTPDDLRLIGEELIRIASGVREGKKL